MIKLGEVWTSYRSSKEKRKKNSPRQHSRRQNDVTVNTPFGT